MSKSATTYLSRERIEGECAEIEAVIRSLPVGELIELALKCCLHNGNQTSAAMKEETLREDILKQRAHQLSHRISQELWICPALRRFVPDHIDVPDYRAPEWYSASEGSKRWEVR